MSKRDCQGSADVYNGCERPTHILQPTFVVEDVVCQLAFGGGCQVSELWVVQEVCRQGVAQQSTTWTTKAVTTPRTL
jgi:hypothetical protein